MTAKKKHWWKIMPLVSALLLILSFPPWNREYLAWISLLPLFFYCGEQVSYRKSLWGGFSTGLFFLYLYAYMALSVNFVLPLRRSAGSRSLGFIFRFVLRAFLPFSFLFTQKHGDNFILPGCTRGLGATGISALAGVSRSYRRLFRI